MRFTPIHAATVAFVAAAGLALPALAQSGTTSGPAAGTPATMGTGGTTPSTPHQTNTVRNSGGVPITGEQRGQLGGTASTVKPGASDTESGVTPRR
jgi:hypothetical protein